MIGLNNFQIWRLIFVFDPVINIDSLPKVLAASACIRSCLVALTYAASLISIDAVSVSASGIARPSAVVTHRVFFTNPRSFSTRASDAAPRTAFAMMDASGAWRPNHAATVGAKASIPKAAAVAAGMPR